MSTMRDGDPITRSQLLKFNPGWNNSDRAVLAEDLETFGGVEFVYRERGYNRHVLVLNANGSEVMAVSPGTCSGRRVTARVAAPRPSPTMALFA